MQKLKQEQGSITLFVLVAMLFFVLFLTGMYMLSTADEQAGISETAKIKEIYERDLNNIDDVYATLDNKPTVNAPKLTKGMTPIKWNGTSWVDTTQLDDQWYNYEQRKWANVRLEDGSIFVWIPRYAYQITSGWHTSTRGNINIEFLKENTNETYSQKKIDIAKVSGENNWLVSPGFYWDSNNNGREDTGEGLTGIWVAKYEASNDNGKIRIKQGVQSWTSIDISDAFTYCINMNQDEDCIYGLSADKAKVEPHLMKNTEWGIVCYLTISKYGNPSDIANNNSYITGNGGYLSSTTGNETGIFDIKGGASEQVAAYINSDEQINNGDKLGTAELKYKDIYEMSQTGTAYDNYEYNKTKYGDAIYEVSVNNQQTNSLWDNGYMRYMDKDTINISRGGYAFTDASIFSLFAATASARGTGNGFRPTIVVVK